MIEEFKTFIVRGNLVTLAVAFIMGLAFQTVVSSFVDDVVMPIVAVPLGQPDFSSLTLEINDSVIAWGSFVTAAAIFLLTALAVFLLVVKPYNVYESRREKEEAPEAGPTQLDVLLEIRDELRRR